MAEKQDIPLPTPQDILGGAGPRGETTACPTGLADGDAISIPGPDASSAGTDSSNVPSDDNAPAAPTVWPGKQEQL